MAIQHDMERFDGNVSIIEAVYTLSPYKCACPTVRAGH